MRTKERGLTPTEALIGGTAALMTVMGVLFLLYGIDSIDGTVDVAPKGIFNPEATGTGAAVSTFVGSILTASGGALLWGMLKRLGRTKE